MPRYNLEEVVDAPINEAEINNDSTMRQLCEFFIEKNQHHFTKGVLIRLQKSVSNFRHVKDMKYKDIPDNMLDDAISHARSDLIRTELAFLVHDFDRITGVHHTLAYDSRTEL